MCNRQAIDFVYRYVRASPIKNLRRIENVMQETILADALIVEGAEHF